MCLITKQQKPFIAKRDMVVYKELSWVNHEIARSIYEYFSYEIGKLYKTKIKALSYTDNWASYDDKDSQYLDKYFDGWFTEKKVRVKNKLKCFGQGFHSVNKPSRFVDVDYTIYECTIPKGSEYYREPTGCIVSNQIIINKMLE